ncbi:glycosyltransferase [Micromonospora sp. CPCC 206061]|uniref:glycosyltransferase n=1 Tax=Micromonospora sp. CPCC 206061 TaxID=3122410 RepID=UPI002FEF4705
MAHIVDTAPEPIDVALLTRDRDLGAARPYPGLSGRWVGRGRSQVFYLNTRSVRQWLRLWRDLRTTQFDVLYVNSLWNPSFSLLPIIAARLGVVRARRVLVAPRGELSPGALSLKAWKKQAFLKWWDRFLRSMDVVWHASTPREEADIKAACAWARVLVNQNQFALPAEPLPVAAHDGPVRLVFVGRISPVKNLELVMRALPRVSKPLEFDIFGPVEDVGYWRRCQSLMGEISPAVQVKYRGELAPTEVRRTFGMYDAFVFPTLGENFGHVIAESLSAACPVVCSAETPWTETLQAGGGIVLPELTVECLADALEGLSLMTLSERLQGRAAAGNAYCRWRRTVQGFNILQQVRESRQPAGTGDRQAERA